MVSPPNPADAKFRPALRVEAFAARSLLLRPKGMPAFDKIWPNFACPFEICPDDLAFSRISVFDASRAFFAAAACSSAACSLQPIFFLYYLGGRQIYLYN